jgi:uncharacterized membrane protein
METNTEMTTWISAARLPASPPSANPAQETLPIFVERFLRDPLGNTLAVIVLLGMVVVVIRSIALLASSNSQAKAQPAWWIPALSLIGIGVATYLTFIESTGAEAFCGPVGDCNSVQQSPYAFLFGVIPVGLLGLLGYLAILGIWLVAQRGPERWRAAARIGLWGLAIFGVLFSIYLTFLEPFVIGATCIWCITSAVVMTAVLWLTTPPAQQALRILEDAALDAAEAHTEGE